MDDITSLGSKCLQRGNMNRKNKVEWLNKLILYVLQDKIIEKNVFVISAFAIFNYNNYHLQYCISISILIFTKS